MTGTISTAGRADPYWYEWFVGLIEVMELLNPEGDVVSVAFQVEGVKGWDDVVVQLRDGRRRCYQVKHSRVADSLTLGDLVGLDEDGSSLLGTLFEAWRESRLDDGRTMCILYTNREAGTRWSTTQAGTRRPPLVDLWKWVQSALPSIKSLDETVPPDDFKHAWEEWKTQLAGGTSKERLAFLRALDIRIKQDDTDGLLERVAVALADSFGVDVSRVSPLVDALHRALRPWTTGHAAVTSEDLMSALAIPANAKSLAPAPPPPTPFFPSRLPLVSSLEKALTTSDDEQIVFLSGDPGSGKTSVLSQLSNRRPARPFESIIGLRYFCFEPIRPESPFIAPDASRVRPEELWFSLLAQLREGLKGRLRDLSVPVRDDFLTWQDARTHVLRLASLVGDELQRPFVIVVDGIDHAARASQSMPEQSRAFLASLPGPEELKGRRIRFLIAGQPPEFYSDRYPTWLCGTHPSVRRVDLPLLQRADVAMLYSDQKSKLPLEQSGNVVDLIFSHGKGNTLSTVFAVAEASRAASLAELDDRLRSRRLSDGLDAYYASIWSHMLQDTGRYSTGIEPSLVGVISLARRSISPELLANMFVEWQQPVGWWRARLDSLGPLLTSDSDGYRVRHNDVRVFLASRFMAHALTTRNHVTGLMADWYLRETSDRLDAHTQLLDLLTLSGRRAELSRVFTVHWVFEAGALGIDSEQLRTECSAAVEGLTELRDWNLVVTVACAAQTLDRLIDARENSAQPVPLMNSPLPPFLPSEARVRPLSQWTARDLGALVDDAFELIRAEGKERARALLARWLDNLKLCESLPRLPGALNKFAHRRDDDDRLDRSFQVTIENLGRLSAILNYRIPFGEVKSRVQIQTASAFEKGFVAAVTECPSVTAIAELFAECMPRFMSSWDAAVRALAKGKHWRLVRDALSRLEDRRSKFDCGFLAEATWWSLMVGVEGTRWLEPLSEPRFGVSEKPFGTDYFPAFVNVARALGWTRLDLNPHDIADTVYSAYDPEAHFDDYRAPAKLVFAAVAILGRAEGAFARGGPDEARSLVNAGLIGTLLRALWGLPMRDAHRFPHRETGTEVAAELTELCAALGSEFDAEALAASEELAKSNPIDGRRLAVQSVLLRHKVHGPLKRWIEHWLAEDGEVWSLSRDDVRRTVESFADIAEIAGKSSLICQARERVRWMSVGYSGHKEYVFEDVLAWFRNLARIAPDLWNTHGWTLWGLCDACKHQNGDNRLDDSIRFAVGVAAISCGAASWWQLFASSLYDISDYYWCDESRRRFVDAANQAMANGVRFSNDDTAAMWSIGLALSRWFESGQNKSLKAFRETLFSSTAATGSRTAQQARIAQSSRSQSLDVPLPSIAEREPAITSDEDSAELGSLDSIIVAAQDGHKLLPSFVAHAIDEVARTNNPDRDILVPLLLSAVGDKDRCGWSWDHVDRDVPKSLDSIARVVSDSELWSLILNISQSKDQDANPSFHGTSSNLLSVALARAVSRGRSELSAGLEAQLDMHRQWAFGGGLQARADCPQLVDREDNLSWQTAALKLFAVLLRSLSAEVLESALEGIHALVEANDAIIPQLFALRRVGEWQQHWILSAAEMWARRNPKALAPVRMDLAEIMETGTLHERLQSWIVLCALCDATGEPRPDFVLDESNVESSRNRSSIGRLLKVPPRRVGRAQFIDRYSAPHSLLHNLRGCGWNFGKLESQIANYLPSEEDDCIAAGRQEAHVGGDFVCTSLGVETAVGCVIMDALARDGYDLRTIPSLAQGFLANEDAWLQQYPPRQASHHDDWITLPGPSMRDELHGDEVGRRLRLLTEKHDVPEGWRTFAAFVVAHSSKQDYAFRLWWEVSPEDLVIRPIQHTSIPSGRSFIWWLGNSVFPEADPIVSCLFVGGHQRLHHSHFEIQPSPACQELLGWSPDPFDPTVWLHEGAAVAKYERLHGPLAESSYSSGPTYRRCSVINRWLVTKEGFEQFEQALGSLVSRHELQAHLFKE